MVVLSEWLRGIALVLPSSMDNHFLFVKFHSLVILYLLVGRGLYWNLYCWLILNFCSPIYTCHAACWYILYNIHKHVYSWISDWLIVIRISSVTLSPESYLLSSHFMVTLSLRKPFLIHYLEISNFQFIVKKYCLFRTQFYFIYSEDIAKRLSFLDLIYF